MNLLLVLLFLISSCGGGGTDSDSDDPFPSPTQTPISGITPGSIPDPVATSTPPSEPTPMFTPTFDPENLEVEIQLINRNLELNWTDLSANNYRILIWSGNATPLIFNAVGTELETAIAPGDYTLLVEAYDELGSSVFSEPEFIEVQ